MDEARRWSDKELRNMRKKLNGIYAQSYDEMTEKWARYMERSNERLASLQTTYEEALAAGTKEEIAEAKAALRKAKTAQTFQNKYYRDMVKDTAKRISTVNQTAISYVNGRLPTVASVNYNQLARRAKKVGIAFDLVDEHTVMRMVRAGDIRLPKKKLDPTKDIPWNTKKLNSAVLQGIIQGEDMKTIARRITPIIDTNKTGAIRTARTCVTGAENAGRQASYRELERKGAIMTKQWMATGDDRTRESHAEIDGEEVGIDEPFSNGLMYPADPDGEPEEVYNCRCTMVTNIKGFVDEKGTEHDIEEPTKKGGFGAALKKLAPLIAVGAATMKRKKEAEEQEKAKAAAVTAGAEVAYERERKKKKDERKNKINR